MLAPNCRRSPQRPRGPALPYNSPMTRRTFLLYNFAAGCQHLLRAQTRATAPAYDLLVKGGRVVDPSQRLSAPRDVAITGHKIGRLAASIPESEARQVLDARGKIVTPGLIDIHVHVYDGVAPLGIPADPNCIA